MRILLLSFLAIVAHGCSNGGAEIQFPPLPEATDIKNETEVPHQFFAYANWAFNEPDCSSNEEHLRIHFGRSGFRSVAYQETVTITEYPVLDIRVFPDARDRIEMDVKSDTDNPAPDTIEFRLFENGQRLQLHQIGAPKNVILFRCFIASD